MYKNLFNEMVKKQVSVDEVAKSLELTTDEFLKKANRVVTEGNEREYFFTDEALIIKEEYFPDLPIEYLFAIDETQQDNSIRELVLGLDYSLGSLNAHIETLAALETEMGHIAEDVENTDKFNLESMGLRFRDIDHKILMVSSLLQYLLNDLRKDYKDSESLKKSLFDKTVKNNEQQND